MIQEFPKAVYRNGEYAEAADQTELESLYAQGYADWSIDSVRSVVEIQHVAETQQNAQNEIRTKRPYNRKPKAEQ
jgi:hypothetical protein